MGKFQGFWKKQKNCGKTLAFSGELSYNGRAHETYHTSVPGIRSGFE
jgi:hypothetical protein